MRPLTSVTRLLAGVAAFMSVCGNTMAAGLDPSDKDYLQSAWVLKQAPDPGVCHVKAQTGVEGGGLWSDWGEYIEFEFERTGGHILFYAPADLYGTTKADSVSKINETIHVTATNPNGNTGDILIDSYPPDRIGLRFPRTDERGRHVWGTEVIAYRCGISNPSVTARVSSDFLAFFSPRRADQTRFIQVDDRIPDEQRCSHSAMSRQDVDQTWFGLNLVGPAHFYLLDGGLLKKLGGGFYVRLAEQSDPETLKITLEDIDTAYKGWNFSSGNGRRSYLTFIRHGERVTVAELNKTFVRCPSGTWPGP